MKKDFVDLPWNSLPAKEQEDVLSWSHLRTNGKKATITCIICNVIVARRSSAKVLSSLHLREEQCHSTTKQHKDNVILSKLSNEFKT